jgi:hypothetical protein
MSRDVPPNELPKAVKRLRLDDCFAAGRTIVLDSEPLVIPEAVNLGGFEDEGKIIGVGNPVGRFRKFLEAAAQIAARR